MKYTEEEQEIVNIQVKLQMESVLNMNYFKSNNKDWTNFVYELGFSKQQMKDISKLMNIIEKQIRKKRDEENIKETLKEYLSVFEVIDYKKEGDSKYDS